MMDRKVEKLLVELRSILKEAMARLDKTSAAEFMRNLADWANYEYDQYINDVDLDEQDQN